MNTAARILVIDMDSMYGHMTWLKASGGGKYDTFKAHAASLGRAADWKEWSEDEPCSQRGAAEDPLGSHTSNMCR